MSNYNLCDEEHPYFAKSCCDNLDDLGNHKPQCAESAASTLRCMAHLGHPETYHVSYKENPYQQVWWK